MVDYLILCLGIIFAGIGGEFFVRGTVGLASLTRMPPGIIGATVAAFATSSPELSVSISSALAGKPQISLGDALGSNVVNVALILGLALVISGIQCPRESVRRDLPMAFAIPVITAVLFLDGVLSRADGVCMLAIFLVWLFKAVVDARTRRSANMEVQGEYRMSRVAIYSVVGLALLVVAGHLIVTAARAIAISFGIDEFVIGATIVAVGTSVPELATTLIAKLRGHDEVGLGTVLGSNIFNGAFIVAVAASIHPVVMPFQHVAVVLVFGIATIVLVYPPRNGVISRWRGLLLLVLYGAYVSAILRSGVV